MEQEFYIKKLPQAEVIDLREIITVEEQQVSSLTLVQRPSLAMTLLSLDKGSSIGGHSSPGDAMVNILSGLARITIADKEYNVKPGDYYSSGQYSACPVCRGSLPDAAHSCKAGEEGGPSQ